jgi:N-acetylneuraminate synthase/sialic acid synthase
MPPELIIEDRVINDDADCYVIAEIGANHMGDVEIAKEMITKARESGVNAVKFQKRDNKSLFTKEMYDSPYVNPNSFGPTYGEHRDALEFGLDEFSELIRHSKEEGVTMITSAFDFNSADFLAELEMPAYKTASADITNTPFLKYIAEIGKPMIVSTGGSSLEDVQRAYDTIMPINDQICFLQCTSSYPAEAADMNLNVIQTYKDTFPDCVIGLSDHQNGIAMALVGYVLGARVIEKHFTLNRGWRGTDQPFSLEPGGLRRLVRDLGRAKVAFGDGVKRRMESEIIPLKKLGKKLVAARNIPAGHKMTAEDFAIKVPNDGLPPYHLDAMIGQVTTKALEVDENVTFEVLEESA